MNRFPKLFMLSVLCVSCFLLSQYQINKIRLQPEQNVKNILYWTPMFQQLDFNLGLGAKIFENCTYTNCHTTHDKAYMPIDQFDAIIFHGIEYREDIFGKPNRRDPRQIYIFSNQESPVYTPHFIKKYGNFFNWTMTHRLDSDVVRPYGFVRKKKTNYQPPSAEEVEKRPKNVAWLASNCGTASERELIVKELSKYVSVEVYGTCGNLSCPKEISRKCYELIEENYKFYLSFENSVCEDYVTEKLYNLLERNIVPIVYGGANYKKIAPPNSVINVMDYKSVKQLAEYIQHLDEHPQEYLRFFEWKKHYVIDTTNSLVLCSLCQKLNEQIQLKSYSDMWSWWQGKNREKCTTNFIRQFL